MTRIQKQISLPSEYWEAIESNIDNRLVRSRGDALIGILEKAYPHLTKVIIPPATTNPKANTHISKSVPVIPDKQDPTMCACGHPESYHSDDGCLGEGGLCECKKLTERTKSDTLSAHYREKYTDIPPAGPIQIIGFEESNC